MCNKTRPNQTEPNQTWPLTISFLMILMHHAIFWEILFCAYIIYQYNQFLSFAQFPVHHISHSVVIVVTSFWACVQYFLNIWLSVLSQSPTIPRQPRLENISDRNRKSKQIITKYPNG